MIHKAKTDQLVTSAKILGLNVSSDLKVLKWNSHIDSIVKKAKKRLYSLSQLKRSGLGTRELVKFFCTCIRPITDACPVCTRVSLSRARSFLRPLLPTHFSIPSTSGRKGFLE